MDIWILVEGTEVAPDKGIALYFDAQEAWDACIDYPNRWVRGPFVLQEKVDL
jgi:hypothetical protein